jgi:hypothetical protein
MGVMLVMLVMPVGQQQAFHAVQCPPAQNGLTQKCRLGLG